MIFAFCLAPMGIGALLQYIFCRLTMRQTGPHWKKFRLLRYLPAVFTLATIALVAAARWHGWQNQLVSPLTQILLIPGIPGVCALIGLTLGWKLWRWHWGPHILNQ